MRFWVIPVVTFASLFILGCMGKLIDSPILLVIFGITLFFGFITTIYRTAF